MIHAERVIASSGQLPILVEEAVSNLAGSPLLLDVGAGSSRMGECLKALRPDIDVVGLEYDTQLALNATPEGLRDRVVVGDAQLLPFGDQAFGAVAAVNILHEVIKASDVPTRQEQLQSIFAGMSRVLKPGGKLIVYDGFMPENEYQGVLVHPVDENSGQLLEQFRDEYAARPVYLEESGDMPKTYISDIGSMVTFLTKFNYLKNGQAWSGEREQLYAFADLKAVLGALAESGLAPNSLQTPQPQFRSGLTKLLANYVITREHGGQVYTAKTFPACQMLLTAQKV